MFIHDQQELSWNGHSKPNHSDALSSDYTVSQ